MGTILSGPAIWFSNVEVDEHLVGRRGQERHLFSRLFLPCHRHLPISRRSRGGDSLLLDPNFCYLHFFWMRKSQAGSPSPGFGHPVTYVVFCKHATSCYWFRLRTSPAPLNPSLISPGKAHCSQQGFWDLITQTQQSWRLPTRDTLGLCEGSPRRPPAPH